MGLQSSISLSKWIYVRWRAKQHRVLPSLSVLLQQGESSAGFGKQLHPWEHPEPDFPGGTCSRGGKTTESQNILVWKRPIGIIEPDSWPCTSQESSVNDQEGNRESLNSQHPGVPTSPQLSLQLRTRILGNVCSRISGVSAIP